MSFTEELKKHWAAFLVTGLFGGLLVQAFTMTNKLTEVSTTVNGLTQRVDRIASTLPDISVRVAQEELSHPIQAAVFILPTKRTSTGEWIAPVQLLSSDSNTRVTYWVPVAGPDDSLPGIITSGFAVTVDKSAASFETASRWSVEAKESSQPPGWVQKDKSFLLRAPAGDYQKILEDVLKSAFPKTTKQTTTLRVNMGTWKDLSAELTTNSNFYTGMTKREQS